MRYTNTMTTAPEYIYHNTPQIDDVLLKLIKRVEKTGALTSVQLNAFLNECNRGIPLTKNKLQKSSLFLGIWKLSIMNISSGNLGA